MTRKTGKVALKARQMMRAAKLAQQKRELERAGISMKLEKPSLKALKEKKLYLELLQEEQESSGGEGEKGTGERPSGETAEESQQKEETSSE
ncbi:MAG: hypothetical protein QXG38_01980 [Candidatus Hadarchaeales archaeon]